MNLMPRDNALEFNRFLFQEIDLNDYRFKYLNYYLGQAQNGVMPVYETSILNVSESGWVLILHGESLMIYGENWNNSQFEELRGQFDFNDFNNFGLTGNENLINDLVDFFQFENFQIIKRRVFYRAEEITQIELNESILELGTLDQLEELAQMLQEYYHEEYSGENDKRIEEMRLRTISLIQNEQLFVLVSPNEEILAFCTINDPDIGILFTKERFRNNGYGKMLLSYCSNLLLQMNDEVFVMTDRDNRSSNVVCESIGFVPFFNYSMLEINRNSNRVLL